MVCVAVVASVCGLANAQAGLAGQFAYDIDIGEKYREYVNSLPEGLRGGPGEGFISFTSFLHWLPQEDRAAILTRAASKGAPGERKSQLIFEGFDTPEAFKLIADDSAKHLYLAPLDEPLSQEWITSLQEFVSVDTEYKSSQLRAAAYLHRNGVQLGTDYLVATATMSGDIDAVRILSLVSRV